MTNFNKLGIQDYIISKINQKSPIGRALSKPPSLENKLLKSPRRSKRLENLIPKAPNTIGRCGSLKTMVIGQPKIIHTPELSARSGQIRKRGRCATAVSNTARKKMANSECDQVALNSLLQNIDAKYSELFEDISAGNEEGINKQDLYQYLRGKTYSDLYLSDNCDSLETGSVLGKTESFFFLLDQSKNGHVSKPQFLAVCTVHDYFNPNSFIFDDVAALSESLKEAREEYQIFKIYRRRDLNTLAGIAEEHGTSRFSFQAFCRLFPAFRIN